MTYTPGQNIFVHSLEFRQMIDVRPPTTPAPLAEFKDRKRDVVTNGGRGVQARVHGLTSAHQILNGYLTIYREFRHALDRQRVASDRIARQLPYGKEYTVIVHNMGKGNERVEIQPGVVDILHSPETDVQSYGVTGTNPNSDGETVVVEDPAGQQWEVPVGSPGSTMSQPEKKPHNSVDAEPDARRRKEEHIRNFRDPDYQGDLPADAQYDDSYPGNWENA